MMMTLAEYADKYGDEEAIRVAVEQLKIPIEDAIFMIAIGRGEISGDIVGDEGNEKGANHDNIQG